MKITIIGAGVIGISTAFFLNQQGHEITIIERASGPGLETSFANGGLLTPSLSDPWNSPGIFWKVLKYLGRSDTPFVIRANALASLGKWGLDFLRYSSQAHFQQSIKRNAVLGIYNNQLIDEVVRNIQINFEYNNAGTMMIFRDKPSFEQAKQFSESLNQLEIPFEPLSQMAAMDKEPALMSIKENIQGGIFYPKDASGNAHLFTKNLAEYLKQKGVKFLYQSKAKLIKNKNAVFLTVNDEKFESDCIILAAGIYSVGLAKEIGISLPLRPCKGYSLTVSHENWDIAPKIPVLDHALHAVITPLGKYIRVAGTAEFAGMNKNLTQERVQNLHHILQKVYPKGYQQTKPQDVTPWTGLRPTCVDGVPLIGPTKFKDLFLNTGHGHLGWTLSLGSGKLLSDYICGTPSPISIAEYQLTRFT
ncbi:MAG: D-amino acid dehydrogenase [Gammaproteobacteria bacterium]|nr:D-amino acid dehydrogenase [Gammaproteobacteria bacterium]